MTSFFIVFILRQFYAKIIRNILEREQLMKKKLLMLFTLFITLLSITSVKADDKPVKDTYKIASDSLFAPFEFQNSDKQYVGIDVDLLKAIA